MKTVMVRYKLKADRVEDNERYVRAVFERLARDRPSGIRYATFKQRDGVSFVHLARIETADGSNPLTALAEFEAFAADIGARCEEPPETFPLDVIGAYGVFAS